MNFGHAPTREEEQVAKAEHKLRHPQQYYCSYLSELARLCESTGKDDAAPVVHSVLEAIGAVFDRHVSKGWSRRATAAQRMLRAGALESAVLHVIPPEFRLDFCTIGGHGEFVAKVVQPDARPGFSVGANRPGMAWMAALLRAAANKIGHDDAQ
ncbi:hypothetical protein [Novosphingobium huizhouense]|uniref:hypothetical protein n=1 Tax=Novosphingobium huizhouense TaxID=2866625 RepID=UPI001CD86E31|nr:hypothetical protein [Novosphingobium huizhouense]